MTGSHDKQAKISSEMAEQSQEEKAWMSLAKGEQLGWAGWEDRSSGTLQKATIGSQWDAIKLALSSLWCFLLSQDTFIDELMEITWDSNNSGDETVVTT